MKHFLHGSKQPVSKALIVLISMLLTPLAAMAQTGFWTDEGNYDKTWPSAEDIDGDYYNIRNEADLAAFANLVNTGKETFKGKIVRIYNTHIDLTDHYWIPVGSDDKVYGERKFEGTFDGMGHRFENVMIDIDQMLTANMDVEEIGFFINNYGTIKNVSLQSMQIRGTEYEGAEYNTNRAIDIGGVAVYNMEGAVIENCIIFDDPLKVTEQASLVNITEDLNCSIGGICHMNYGTIRKCRNEKPIEIIKGDIGGVVWWNYGTLIECENSRSLRSSMNWVQSVAGVASCNFGNGIISGCTNSGDLSAYHVSGIVNVNGGNLDESCIVRVENCVNTGRIEGHNAAGIGNTNDGQLGEAKMQNNRNEGYIIGKKAAGIVAKNCDVLECCINIGQVDGFYSAAGIVCSSSTYVYTISNCENQGKITAINDGSDSKNLKAYAGGICADGLSINNCRNMGQVYASAPAYAYAGGILAYFSFRDMNITYCYNTASISAVLEKGRPVRAYSGGIVGESDSSNGRIYNCFNSGKISCENKMSESEDIFLVAGGILGHLSGSTETTVSNSYNSGDILTKGAPSHAYAIGGWEINASFNTGSVNAYGLSTGNYAPASYGIGLNASNCLSLGKSITSTNVAYKVGGNTTEQGNYASTLLKLETKDGDCSSLEGVDANGDHGRFWKPDMIAPIDAWSTDAWDKSENTILPQLKYADGTLMPDQPRLLRSDYAGDAPAVSVKMAYNGFDLQYIGAGETVERSMSPIYFDVPSLDQDYRIVLEMENADKLAINYGEGPFGDMNPLAFTDGKATILKSECRIDTEGGKMRVIPYLDIMAEEAGDYPYTIKVYDETGTTCYAEFPSVFKAVVPVSLTTEKIEGNILAGVPFDIQIAGAGTFSGKEVSLRMFMNYHVDDSLTLTYQDSKVPFVKENEDYMNTGLDIALTDQVYLFTLTGKKATTSDQAYLSFALYHEDRMIPTAGSSWAPLSLSSSFIIDETGSKVEDEIVDEITIAENTTESTDTLDVKLSGVTTGKLTINAEAIAKVEISGTNDFGEVTNNGTFILNAAIEAEVNLTYTTIVNNGVFADSTGLVTEVGGEAGLAIGEIRQQASAGSTITLTATATPGGDYISVVFTWQMLVNGEWATLESNQKAVAKSISQLRVSEPVTDTYTANAEDEGLYRCVITSKVSEEVSTTLVSMAEIKSASDPDPDPDPTPDPDPEIPTGVKQTEDGSLRVWAADRQLHIQSPKAETAYIVSFNGQTNMLAVPVGETIVNMPQGSYIIHIGKQSYKLKF